MIKNDDAPRKIKLGTSIGLFIDMMWKFRRLIKALFNGFVSTD